VERRRPFVLWRSNPVGALLSMKRYPVIIGLFLAMAFYFIGHDVNPSTWTYYVLHKFRWSEWQIGLALAVVGLSGALVSGMLVGPIVKRIGEAQAVYLGLALAALGFFGYAFATEGWMIFPCICLGAFMGLVMPSLRSIMTRVVPPDEQGELQGAIGSLMGLTAIVAPLLMTQTFRHFSVASATVYFPGAAFLLAGCFMIVAALAVRRALSRLALARAGGVS
jgi:DHA1 family tetracycline resistance protein-like MFS transporter